MTKEQAVRQFIEYADYNGIPCEFKEDKKGTLMSAVEVSVEDLSCYTVRQIFCIYNNGNLSSALDIDFQIPESKFRDVEKLVSMINEAEGVIEFRLFKKYGSIGLILSYGWDDEDFFDERIMDAFYNLPFIILQNYSEAFLSVIESDISPEEALSGVQGGDDNDEETGRSQDFEMVRYHFEHEWLRDYYYENTCAFVDKILKEKGNFLYRLMEDLCKIEGVEMKYDGSEYKVFHHKANRRCSIIRAVMPRPESPLNCFEIFLIYSDDFQHKRYFTVEKARGIKERFLCSWDAASNHHNHGICGKGTNKTEKDIIRIFDAMERTE